MIMPIRRRLLLNRKKKMRKEQRINNLIQLYETIHRGGGPRLPPDVESIEKLVAFHYPRLSQQTKRKYAKLLYESLRQRPKQQ